jgi:hypothetical protein
MPVRDAHHSLDLAENGDYYGPQDLVERRIPLRRRWFRSKQLSQKQHQEYASCRKLPNSEVLRKEVCQ